MLGDPTSLGAFFVLGVVFCATYALALVLIVHGVARDLRGLRELARRRTDIAAPVLTAEPVP